MVQQGYLLFFRPEFFPMTMEQGPGKKAPGPVFHVHVPEGAKLELGLQNFGPWTVELSLVHMPFTVYLLKVCLGQVDKVSDIEPPAQLQTTDILKGELDYTVSVGASYLIKRSKPPKMFRSELARVDFWWSTVLMLGVCVQGSRAHHCGTAANRGHYRPCTVWHCYPRSPRCLQIRLVCGCSK